MINISILEESSTSQMEESTTSNKYLNMNNIEEKYNSDSTSTSKLVR